MTENRKLAAILAADVVGFSRMAGADEDRTLARLRALRSDLVDPTVAVHHGRVFKRTGDGSLIEFRSVVDAVRCAIEVQNAMIERNAGLPPERRIDFRVGIHLGDVVEESDGDLMGDGVNIAARLEGIGQPGMICLSEDAYRQVSGRLEMQVTDLGPTQLKNIAKPIRAYSLRVGGPQSAAPKAPASRLKPLGLFGGAVALIAIASGAAWRLSPGSSAPATGAPQTAALSEPARPSPSEARNAGAEHLSIVLLPFANLSNDPAQDYFADGVTESLTTDLSRLSGSLVIARNTAFTFKGKAIDVKQIGKELGVRYALEGSVQRDAGRLRVNVQLIDAETGNHIWAERFDKPLADLFDMQDEIVARLASQLGTQLVAFEAQRAARSPSPDSMELYFQGLAAINKGFNPALLAQGEDFFQRALALDPGNIDAQLGTARVDVTYCAAYLTGDRAAHFASAESKLGKVLSQAPNNPWAHYWLAIVLEGTNRGAQAMAELDRALEIDPNLAAVHAEMGTAYLFNGRAAETEGVVKEALRLSPRDNFTFVWFTTVGAAKLHLGADEEAVTWLRKSLDANPNLLTTHLLLAAAFANLGRLPEARAAGQVALTMNPNLTVKAFRAGAESDNAVFLKQR